MDDMQVLFNIVLGVAAFLGGWTVNNLTRSIERLDKDIRSMPLTYLTQTTYQRDIDDIKSMLGKIFDNLDEKMDK